MNSSHTSRWLAAILPAALVAGSCGSPAAVEPPRIVDLSPTITPDLPTRMIGARMIAEFGFRGETEFEQTIGEEPLYYQDSYVTLFNHAGPHVDAPIHVIRGAATTAEYDLARFYGRARVLDFSARTDDGPITLEEIRAEAPEPGDIVILHTGYAPPADSLSYPDMLVPTAEAAEYLASLPVKAYAVDTPSSDDLVRMFDLMGEGVVEARELLPVHHALLGAGIPVIEGLVNTGALLSEEDVVFVGFPLKMRQPGGDAGQMRAVALAY